MNPINLTFLGVITILVLGGVIAVIRANGIGVFARTAARELATIRTVEVMGCGIRLIGIRPAADPHQRFGSFWLTAFYLPLIPLARRVVRFVEPRGADSRWVVLEVIPLDWRDVARTYCWGWIVFPLLVIGPLILAPVLNHAPAWLP